MNEIKFVTRPGYPLKHHLFEIEIQIALNGLDLPQ